MSISRELAVSNIRPDEYARAAELLGIAYQDNPMMFALYGDDPYVRRHTNEVVFGVRMAPMLPVPLVARDGDRVVGVCGFDTPGGSKMTPEHLSKLMRAMAEAGPDVPRKVMDMLVEWGTKTPPEPHWNLGPVGVDPAYHGQGIGSAMVAAFCEMVDARHDHAFLETDLEKNARLYARFGFKTIEQATIHGLPMWFMWRPAS